MASLRQGRKNLKTQGKSFDNGQVAKGKSKGHNIPTKMAMACQIVNRTVFYTAVPKEIEREI